MTGFVASWTRPDGSRATLAAPNAKEMVLELTKRDIVPGNLPPGFKIKDGGNVTISIDGLYTLAAIQLSN